MEISISNNADFLFYKGGNEMANKKVTYTLELDAEISSLESKLKGAKAAFGNLNIPNELKKQL
jgi:hypothetical protein